MFKALNLTGLAAAAALMLGLFAAETNAATITTIKEPTSFTFVNPATAITPVGGTLTAPSGLTTQNTSLANAYKSPWIGSSSPNAFYYNLASGNVATFTANGVKTIFSLLWGSVDTHNSIRFSLGNTAFLTVVSANLTTPNVATPGNGAAFVTISDIVYDKVEFISGGTAFEFANVVAAVPLPAGALLLVTALGGFGIARRLRKTA